ncbi:MAG: hypothetical protein HYT77_09195 [Deltaproteobacteria bacterium]|nr:hypothetical protein [Deltaproteobacteria bacterium]
MFKVNRSAILKPPGLETDGESLSPPVQRDLRGPLKYQPGQVQPGTKLILSLLFLPLGLFTARWATRLRQLNNSAKSLIWEAQPWLVGRVERCPNLPGFVEELLHLSPDERRTLLSMVRDHSPPIDRDMQRVLKLTLFDPETWDTVLEDLSTHGTRSEALYTTLVPLLERMPRSLQDSLFAKIPTLYPLAEKGGWFIAECVFPPKRAIDAFVRGILRPEQIISQAVRDGKTTWEAYQVYLETVRTRIFANTPYGDYTIEDVQAVVESIRAVLKKDPSLGEEASVILYGSFPNGRALIASSDLDVVPSTPRLVAFYHRMDAAISESLRPRHPDIDLRLQESPIHFDPTNMAIVNPVMLRISAAKTELLVYSPSREPLVYSLS